MSDFKMPVGGKVSDVIAEREIDGEEVRDTVYGLPLPPCDMTDAADVEAWFESKQYAVGEHVRTMVKAQCKELIRAEYAARGEKISDGRTDDLARLHPSYLEIVKDLLVGRRTLNQDRANTLRNGA